MSDVELAYKELKNTLKLFNNKDVINDRIDVLIYVLEKNKK